MIENNADYHIGPLKGVREAMGQYLEFHNLTSHRDMIKVNTKLTFEEPTKRVSRHGREPLGLSFSALTLKMWGVSPRVSIFSYLYDYSIWHDRLVLN